MGDFDPAAQNYNTMQQQAGLLPPVFQPPPVPFPGQVSAAMSQGGPAAVSFLTTPSSGPGFPGSTAAQFSPMAAQMATGGFMTQGSAGTSFGAGFFPGQQLQGFTNQSPMFQGPTGVMMPMTAAASFNTYPGVNPYAGLAARGPYQGAPGLFSPYAPAPPPAYAGQMAQVPPLMPPPAAAMFNTSYGAGLERQQVRADTAFAHGLAGGGILSRLGTDFAAGAAGAALGGRFGGGIGAAIGGIGGFLGSEFSGLARGAQNLFMNQIGAPMIQQRAMTAGIEELSRGFISSGPGLHASGAGFSHEAASQVASGLRDMASSQMFQRQTGNRFNQQDLFKITQEAAHNDMFTGVQNPEQMTGRVREVAKSLSAFMQLAQEPDIQRAIQTMGQLRASGLNLAETTQAVSQGRTFARMAGQSFADLAAQGGAMGSQTFQSMGLTQGLGMQTGMMNYALSRGAQTGGTLNPQLMNLVGGASGLANLNNVFSASMLQMPMLAPSVMSSSGGINLDAMQNLLSGNTNAFDQTRAGTSALQSMARLQGPGGLGAAIAMQPMLQDTIGRALQAQGPFAQRSFENQNIMSTMRQMGMSGSTGFLTMAQTMGMDRSQAMARLQELQDPAYFQRQRDQINTRRREARQAEIERNEAEAPGMFDEMTRLDPTGLIRGTRNLGQGIGRFRRHLGHLGAELAGAQERYEPTNREIRRDLERTTGSREMTTALREIEADSRPTEGSFGSRFNTDYDIGRRMGGGVLGAGIAALMPRSAESRTAFVNDMNRGSSFAAGIMTTTAGDRRTALRQENINRTFGAGAEGSQRLQNFSAEIARTMAGTNMFGSEALGAVAGFITPGAGDGQRAPGMRQMEDAYVRTMRGTGRSDAELRQQFQQNAPQIAAQASVFAQGMMTPEERDRARRLAQGRINDPRDTGFGEAAQRRVNAGVSRMFGGQSGESNEVRRAASQIFENAAERGGSFGRNPEERRKSREMMGTLSMYQAVLANPRVSPEDKEKARRQISQLQAHAAQTFGADRAADMVQSSLQNNLAGSINNDPAQRDAALAFVRNNANNSAENIMRGVAQGRTEQEQGEAALRMKDTASVLAARGGELGKLFEGAAGSQFSMSRVSDRLGGMTDDQLTSLAREGASGRKLAQAARMLRSGDPEQAARAQQILQGALGGDAAGGDRARRLRREHQEQFEGIGGFFRGALNRAGIAYTQTEDEYVNEGLAAGTEADRVADEQTERVNAEEAAAREAGIGGDRDPMVQAAAELREAAQALNRVVQGGALDRAVAGE
jgi:hypothetical protein